MPVFKFTIIILVVFIPFMLLLTEFVSSNSLNSDADTALRQAALVGMKDGVVEGSLRDTNIPGKEDQITANVDPDTVSQYFDGNFTSNSVGTVINLAEQDSNIAISHSPPMLAVRSNTVKENSLFSVLNQFFDDIPPAQVIQNEKIVIVETIE